MKKPHEDLLRMLCEDGIAAEYFRLNYRMEAIRVRRTSQADRIDSFWLRHSERGWFLTTQRIWRIPDRLNVVEVCKTIVLQIANSQANIAEVVAALGLDEQPSFFQDEKTFQIATWATNGWELLPDADERRAWDEVELKFGLPGPEFRPPIPSAVWNASHAYEFDWPEYERAVIDFNEQCLKAFRGCLGQAEYLLALDLNHPGYLFYPHKCTDARELDSWPISVFPESDYHLFTTSDMRLGIGSDPAGTIWVFGNELLNQIANNPPNMLRKQIQRDGVATDAV